MKQSFEAKHIAKLAGINLTQEEVKKFQKQIAEVLEYVDKISKLKLTSIEPTSQVTGLENVFRSDKARPSLTPEKAIKDSRQVQNNFFKAKRIFE